MPSPSPDNSANPPTDYRRIPKALSKVYFSPLNQETRTEMQKLFDGLTSTTSSTDPVIADRPLKIWGRTLKVPESTERVARFSFDKLCGKPLSSADYLEITRNFGTIFVEEVGRMGLGEKDMVSASESGWGAANPCWAGATVHYVYRWYVRSLRLGPRLIILRT